VLYDRGNIIFIDHVFAGQVDCFTQPRALLVLHDRGNTSIIINHAYAVLLNCFTQPRALLVLKD
jgi:hypothetical protein